MKRVVVSGQAGITCLGDDWTSVIANLKKGRSGVVRMDDWDRYKDLRTRIAAPIPQFNLPEHYTRKKIRSMGRVSQLATRSVELALDDAGLLGEEEIHNGSMGISFGSSSGTPKALGDFGNMLLNGSMKGITANTYIKMMSHTAAVNIGVFFGLTGRIITTSSACTSGSQGIGYAYETIKYGLQTMMVAGGAEELDATQAAVFDTLFATSTRNDTPESSPRPFDRDRDGLVIGEGASTLVLEELDHAKSRGAKIYAEVIGFSCNSDGSHVTQPNSKTMAIALSQAMKDADIPASEIGYVNAHGTATEQGDIAESQATFSVLGTKPISSLKSYFGHSLGACGAIEAWLSIGMMNNDWYAPTINLENVDENCADLDFLMTEGRVMSNEYVMSNNFAFGGINTSLIFKRWM